MFPVSRVSVYELLLPTIVSVSLLDEGSVRGPLFPAACAQLPSTLVILSSEFSPPMAATSLPLLLDYVFPLPSSTFS